MASLTSVFIGIQKRLEPSETFTLSWDYLECHHRYGGWSLPWHEIRACGIPSLVTREGHTPIEYVGLALFRYDSLLDGISPRLISHLIQEQRSLILAGHRCEYPLVEVPADWLLEGDDYRTPEGKRYGGLQAMLANRMDHCRQVYGYHLLLPASMFDRSPAAFSRLLRRYLVAAQMRPPLAS